MSFRRDYSEKMYNDVYELLKKGPVSTAQIKKITHKSVNATQQFIVELSFVYPIFSPRNGIYMLLTKELMDEYQKEEREIRNNGNK